MAFDMKETGQPQATSAPAEGPPSETLANGLRLYQGERYPEAAVQFQRVIDLTPDNAAAHSNIGGILVLLKRAEEARVSLEEVRYLDVSSPAGAPPGEYANVRADFTRTSPSALKLVGYPRGSA